jgi:hypothetical protein
MEGLGVYLGCASGSVYFGHRSADLKDGLGVSVLPSTTTYAGAFSQDLPTLGTKTVAAGNAIAIETGEQGKSGLEGYGVLVCSDASKWKGTWHKGRLAGPAVKYDQYWNVLAHGTFGREGGQTRPPTSLCG